MLPYQDHEIKTRHRLIIIIFHIDIGQMNPMILQHLAVTVDILGNHRQAYSYDA